MAQSALDDINQAFHGSYDDACDAAKSDGPVFVLLADTLVIHRRGARQALSFTPQTFHRVKAVAHAPVAVYATLRRSSGQQIDAGTHDALVKLKRWIETSKSDLEHAETALAQSVTDELLRVLDECAAFVDAMSPTSTVDAGALDAFARKMGPLLIDLTEHATRIQIAALDAHVNRELGVHSEEEIAELQVVVTGDHQARVRSLAMQYFRKRLREPAGVEERVTYAEGVSDERDAMLLVGKRRVDRTIARAFFGDPRRLQSDILGAAAEKVLEGWDETAWRSSGT